MNITLWPLVSHHGKWSMPDTLLLDIWGLLIDSGKHDILFYDGTVETGLQWLNFVKSLNRFFVFAVCEEKQEFVGMGWVSNVQYGTGEAHFSYFKKYIPGCGEMVLKYWEKILPLHVIYGYTPESYVTVLRLLRKWGFKHIGTIPQFCNMKYQNTREGAVVSYRLMEGTDVA